MPSSFFLQHIKGQVLRDPVSREAYGLAQCIYRIPPRAVVLPACPEDVLDALKVAREEGLPVTARGAGSAVAGQALGSGLVLDFTRHLARILEIRAEEKWARIQPGVVLADLNRALAPMGLRFGPDPASQDFCTLGGMIANNAGGPRSVLYGPTRDHILSLTVVGADGEVWETRKMDRARLQTDVPDGQAEKGRALLRLVDAFPERFWRVAPGVRRRSSGYDLGAVVGDDVDLAQLLVGSEGTLALTMEAKLRLTPLPGAVATALVYFRDLEEMGEGVQLALAHAPSAVEALDRSFLDLIREAGPEEVRGLPRDVEVVLILEVEGESEAAAAVRLQELYRGLVERGPAAGMIRGLTEESRTRIWEIRKAASPILTARQGRRRSTRFIEDACVPTGALPRFIREVRRLLADYQLEAAVFGHAGDSILHVNPMLDPEVPDIRRRMEGIASEFADMILSLGGALSGEHGDGRLRTPFLERVFGDLIRVFSEVKRLFDPEGILNPGIKVHDGRSRLTDHLDLGPRPSHTAGPAWLRAGRMT